MMFATDYIYGVGQMVIVFTLVYALGGNAFLSLLTNDESVIAAATNIFGGL